MRTVIDCHGLRATVAQGRWTTDNPWLQVALPAIHPPLRYTPDVDYALAEAAIQELGGRIVAYDGPPPVPPDVEP